MNLLHMKYAVEIAEAGSINKAAERLYVGQPNLSRAVKELEASLGVAIFDRSSKGMFLTPDGELFIRSAKNILSQVDAVENMFKKDTVHKKRFSISAPRASYVAEAFANFSLLLEKDGEAELYYKETNSMRTIKNVLEEDYRLGIVRYADTYDKYYKEMMDEKGLSCEMVTEFCYVLAVSRESPLADKETVTFGDLQDHIEIAHADPFVPALPFAQVKKEELPDNIRRRICVFERASQFALLCQNPDTFMWVSPVPQKLLDRYGLVQRPCGENRRMYRDVLIRKREYALTEMDNLFISELCKAKRAVFAQQ